MAKKPTQKDIVNLGMLAIAGANIHEVMEMAGVKFGEQVEGDNLFLYAIIPAGWKFKRTDHYMYQDLLDEKGRKRASQMYKAAFYDRDASIHAVPRYSAYYTRDDWGDHDAPDIPAIQDSNGNILWRGEPISKADDKDYGTIDRACAAAREVLNKYIPEYKEIDDKIAALKEATRDKSRAEAAPTEAEITKLSAQRLNLFWDRDENPKLPESLSSAPTGQVYTLHVELYRDDSYVDGGSHTTRRADNDAEAIKKLQKAIDDMGANYDVKWRINQGDRLVTRGEKNKPRPRKTFRRSIDGFGYECDNDGKW
jgi:hypothetical protein